MRKIRKLIIKNFQSHKNTEINFDYYAIIHGATNSGKSAIIRAIKWCLYNEAPPEGAELTRFGEKETEVTICFNDGKTIARKRAGKVNEYILYDETGVATNYTGFGRGPLKEVLDFHGMYQANLFGDPQSINIVDQQEPPFFLSEGPTARGHLISRLAETLTYEAALIMLKKDAGELKRGLEAKRMSIDNLSTEIDKLSYLENLDSFIKQSEQDVGAIEMNDKCINLSPTLMSIVSTDIVTYKDNAVVAASIYDIESLQNEIQNIEQRNNSVFAINNKQDLLFTAVQQWQKHNSVLGVLCNIDDCFEDIGCMEDNYNRAQKIDALLRKIGEFLSSADKLKRSSSLESEILGVGDDLSVLEDNSSLISQIKGIKQKIEQSMVLYTELLIKNARLEETIRNKTEEYKALLVENGTCPTCFSKIRSENLIGVDV
jgi:DNA repair exonuclease SbcCD ATPase subunit